jgi:hypothetical protein
MITEDVLVYAHPDGITYVAIIGEDWWRWPAVEGGWLLRRPCASTLADECWELAPRLGRLALRLSGVEP